MDRAMIKSILNTIGCGITRALEESGVKKEDFTLSLTVDSKAFEKKVFGEVLIEFANKVGFKEGIFVSLICKNLEKEGIKTVYRAKENHIVLNVYMPSRIKGKEVDGELNLKINGEFQILKCRLKPEKVYKHKIKVRFRDLDAMGHVSNNVFLVYLEEARVGFREFITKEKGKGLDFCSVVASHHIEYLSPIFLGEELIVEVFVSHLTKKSYRFNYKILNPDTGQLKAIAYTLMVGYDYKNKKVNPLSESFVDRVEQYLL